MDLNDFDTLICFCSVFNEMGNIDFKILSHLLHWGDHLTSSVINISLILDYFFILISLLIAILILEMCSF